MALVIFAMWNPLYAIVEAYLFGGINALQFQLQATGTSIPSSLLSMQSYPLTLIAVIAPTFLVRSRYVGVPKKLGLPFFREER